MVAYSSLGRIGSMKAPLIILAFMLAGCGHSASRYVWPSQAEVGVDYDANLGTHCGAMNFEMNGSWWHFVGDPYVLDWPEPWDDGSLRLFDESHGVYSSSRGALLPFEKGGSPPGMCM